MTEVARQNVEALARLTCGWRAPAKMVSWDSLDAAGWMSECARLLLGFSEERTVGHDGWAQLLGMRPRTYAAAIGDPTWGPPARAAIVEFARRALDLDAHGVLKHGLLDASPQRHRVVRMVQAALSIARGRRYGEIETPLTPEGLRLEARRVQLQYGVKVWARMLGTSENTYRKYLAAGVIPEYWEVCAARATPAVGLEIVAEVIQPASYDELTAVFGHTYRRSCEARAKLAEAGITPSAALATPTTSLHDVPDEPETFVPSDEVEM